MEAKKALEELAPWIAGVAGRKMGLRNPLVDDLMQEMLLGAWEIGDGMREEDYRNAAMRAMYRFLRAERWRKTR